MISPEQCRAARALLGWSQDDLEAHSSVAKKTIADFEREARLPQERSLQAIKSAIEGFGVVFIPQNGGGDGVRFKDPKPKLVRLFRRDNVEHREWVAFAFDYKGKRHTGFVSHEALAAILSEGLSPQEAFDRERERILFVAAGKVDRRELDPDGRALLQEQDLMPD